MQSWLIYWSLNKVSYLVDLWLIFLVVNLTQNPLSETECGRTTSVEMVRGELEHPVLSFPCRTFCELGEFSDIQVKNSWVRAKHKGTHRCILTEIHKELQSEQTVRTTGDSANYKQPSHIVDFSWVSMKNCKAINPRMKELGMKIRH